jgi:NADPH:quinone reductase-like Zn-dependent oxidoreductase
MLAAYVEKFDADYPTTALQVGERPEPVVPEGWVVIDVRATALNHHDLWSLQGVGLAEKNLPMILGCDAAGIDPDGNEVVVHAVISDPAWKGDETLDPKRSLLSERFQGTLAQKVAVPAQNVVPKPAGLSFEQAACLPTAWLTAYRMLFSQSGLKPGDTVLVQGAGGGVSTALITLARAGGMRVWATSRDEAKRAKAVEIGAHDAFESGARMPERVDAVMDTVGQATWAHSLKALKPGGTLVISGATSGQAPESAELNRIFFLQLRVQGSTMGTRTELAELMQFMATAGISPHIDSMLPLADARKGFEKLWGGGVFGKIVFTV